MISSNLDLLLLSDITIELLNDIRSDHMALIILESACDLEPRTELPLDC